MRIQDFDLGELLGEGSFGTVSEAVLRETGEKFALKMIEVVHIRRQKFGLQQVMTEKKVLIMLEACPNVVRLHSTFKDEDHLYILLERCEGGELFQHIKRLGSCHVSCARWLTAELVNVVEFMHSLNVIHRGTLFTHQTCDAHARGRYRARGQLCPRNARATGSSTGAPHKHGHARCRPRHARV